MVIRKKQDARVVTLGIGKPHSPHYQRTTSSTSSRYRFDVNIGNTSMVERNNMREVVK